MASVTPIKAAAKKTPMKKRRKLPAPRAQRTPHEKRKAAAVDPDLKAAEVRLGQLPTGFVAEGFEIINDQVRIYGKVKDAIGSVRAYADTNVNAETLGRAIGEEVNRYQPAPAAPHRDSPLDNALGSLERRIEEIGIALNELERAACSILLPAPPDVHPNSAGHTTAAAIVEAPAVDELHRLTNCLERLVNRVNSITGRVQA
jgi:hypothetical protein